MTSQRIQEAALARFAANGYEGTSLADIAADVGIKKPSIYAHYASKDALFLRLVQSAIADEINYARRALQANNGKELRKRLLDYLKSIRTRFEATPQMRFWLNVLFLPPAHLFGHPSMDGLHQFMDDLEAIARDAFAHSSLGSGRGSRSAANLAIAYLGIIDSLQVELLYGGPQKFERRLKALWSLFEGALPSY